MNDPSLVIVGASARAAAFSALRGGLLPACADFFADADLQSRCQVLKSSDYPHDLPALAGQLPPSPWMYSGALENYSDIVAEISRTRPLMGNPPAVLCEVRRPERLTELCGTELCRFPDWRTSAVDLPCDGSWLRKAYRSAGGAQVQTYDGRQDQGRFASEWYYQQRVEGTSASALYVAAGGTARLLGASEQLIGTAWCGASGFHYAGSLGPLSLSSEQHEALAALGKRLAAATGLVGIFGVDLVIASDRIWVIEVNPRYPASSEVLERAGNFSAVAWHVAACRDGALPAQPQFTGPLRGKAILFARQDVSVPQVLVSEAMTESASHGQPGVADIPAAGSQVRASWPVMTLLEEATDRDQLIQRLQTAADRWQRMLHPN